MEELSSTSADKQCFPSRSHQYLLHASSMGNGDAHSDACYQKYETILLNDKLPADSELNQIIINLQ